MANGWTIQGLIDGGMTVTAYCHNWQCHHNARLDLVALRERLGPHAAAMHDDLVPKLRCAKCGGKQIGLICTPPTRAGNPFMRP